MIASAAPRRRGDDGHGDDDDDRVDQRLGVGRGGYIDLPVYPGATESKEGAMSVSTNTGSVAIKVYATKDDTKKVADWYKAHLPAGSRTAS